MAKYCGTIDGHEVEVCAECMVEVEIRWDINKDGFKAYCPHCGSVLMLCNACAHRFGKFNDDCDFDGRTHTCRFNKKREEI